MNGVSPGGRRNAAMPHQVRIEGASRAEVEGLLLEVAKAFLRSDVEFLGALKEVRRLRDVVEASATQIEGFFMAQTHPFATRKELEELNEMCATLTAFAEVIAKATPLCAKICDRARCAP